MQKIDGGYVLANRSSLIHLNAQISSRTISTATARGILGFLEMRSIRAGAGALKPKFKGATKRIPNYSSKELQKVTGLSKISSPKVFKEVTTFHQPLDEKGKCIPIPRRLVRFMAQCQKRSTLLVLLTYIERGLALDKGKIKNAGTAKASLIAKKTGVTTRSVRLARAELINLGIITPDTTKYQRKLNRDGAYFTINLSWNETEKKSLKPVENFPRPVSKISPPEAQNRTKISSPYRNKNSSYEVIRNQKPQSRASNSSGVFTKREEEGRGLLKPTIRNVLREDLFEFSRCKELYHQACELKIILRSEASYLNFVAAAVRAKSSKNGDPARIFMGIIIKNLWMNITQEQEDRARVAIKRYGIS